MRQVLTRALFVSAAMGMCGAASAQTDEQPVRPPGGNPASGWARPTIVLAPNQVQPDGGDVVWSWVPGEGMIEATRRTTSGIGAALPSSGLSSQAVEACRVAAWADASRLGAGDIEAAPAGAAKRDRWGRTVAPVRIRLTYPGLVVRVREAVVNCTIDAQGRVVEARI